MKTMDRTWDFDLLKQCVSELSKQVDDLSQEVRRLEEEVRTAAGARENAYREVSALRRVVQDYHLRYDRRNGEDAAAADRTNDPADSPGCGAERLRPSQDVPARAPDGDDRVRPSIIDRIPRSDEVNWVTETNRPPPLDVHPGWGNFVQKGKVGVVIGVSLLGLDAAGRERVIERIGRQQQRHKQLLPVFITDDDDFESLRREHYVFEYLPPWPGPAWEPRESWEAFLVERLVDIRDKFGIELFVSFARGDKLDSETGKQHRLIETYLARIFKGDNT
jgi:hypothetical protein